MTTAESNIRDHKGEPIFLYDQHMPETDALEYLTLKGYLLVEKMVVRLGQLTLSQPEYLKLLNLKSFYGRVCVVRASKREICKDRHWDLVLTLNQVRNDYAHELEPPTLRTSSVSCFKQMMICIRRLKVETLLRAPKG